MLWQRCGDTGVAGVQEVQGRLQADLCSASSCRVLVSLSQHFHNTHSLRSCLGRIGQAGVPGHPSHGSSSIESTRNLPQHPIPAQEQGTASFGIENKTWGVWLLKPRFHGVIIVLVLRVAGISPTPVSSRGKQQVLAACTLRHCEHRGS